MGLDLRRSNFCWRKVRGSLAFFRAVVVNKSTHAMSSCFCPIYWGRISRVELPRAWSATVVSSVCSMQRFCFGLYVVSVRMYRRCFHNRINWLCTRFLLPALRGVLVRQSRRFRRPCRRHTPVVRPRVPIISGLSPYSWSRVCFLWRLIPRFYLVGSVSSAWRGIWSGVSAGCSLRVYPSDSWLSLVRSTHFHCVVGLHGRHTIRFYLASVRLGRFASRTGLWSFARCYLLRGLYGVKEGLVVSFSFRFRASLAPFILVDWTGHECVVSGHSVGSVQPLWWVSDHGARSATYC